MPQIRIPAYMNKILSYISDIPGKIRHFDIILVSCMAGYYIYLMCSHILYNGIWGDESYSITLAMHPIGEIFSTVSLGRDAPLYYLFLHFWEKAFGISEISVRSLSAVFSVSTLILLYIFCKRYLNRQTAFYASLLYIASAFELHYGMETRPYALDNLLALLSFYVFFSMIQKRSLKKWIVLGIINALLIYTHYLGAFMIIVEAVSGLF